LLLRLTGEQLLDVQQLSFLNNEKAFEIIRAMIAGKSKKICPVLDSRMEAANEASRKLKRLQRLDKFIFEERGSNDLHIGWPFVRGKFSDGTIVRCPLLYFPVTLVQESSQWVLVLRKEAGITFNKSFLLAYSFYNQVKLQEELPDTSFEDFDKDSIAFRTQLYELVKDKIEINFNPDTYTDDLTPFREFKKDEFDEHHRHGELKLFPEAVLGIFPQAGSQLVPDYLSLIENKSFEGLEEFFSTHGNEQGRPANQWVASVREENIYAPFALDAYQEHALRTIKAGNSLVVQGPPGTGKSQLIGNLIADAIASGKKVLLVCQKRVALDVVFDRLKKIQLGDFLGLVHDFRNDRKDIYEKIARQVENIEEYKARNRSIDSIQLERRFVHVCRRIDQLTEELEEYRKDLFDDKDCGLSAKELYLTSSPHRPAINLRQEFHKFEFRTWSDSISRIKRYAQYAAFLERDNYVWQNRKSFAEFQVGDLQAIEHVIHDIPAFQQQITDDLNKILPLAINLEECEALLHRQRDAEEMLNLLTDETVLRFFKAMITEQDEETSLLWLQNTERVCVNCFEGASVESSLDMTQLMLCRTALQQRMVARKSLVKWIRWELFSEHKFFLKRVLINNQLQYTKVDLLTLEQRIDNRLNLEHHLTTLRKKSWLIDLPGNYQHQALRHWFALQYRALQAKLIFNSLREMREVIHVQRYSLSEFQQTIRSVFTIISTIPFHRNDWQSYLSPYQVRQLVTEPNRVTEFISLLRTDFDNLCAYDKLKEAMPLHEIETVQKLYDFVKEWDADAFESLFQNSIRLAWLDHIETRFPVLRSVSTLNMEEMETELQHKVEEKQQLVQEILLLRARERVYENIEFNRLSNRVTYRDLNHQVTKKRKIWPLRKLIAEFHHELFNLIPCWMASPESVSAIFPMQEFFDLVIFDEASQCFAERGLPGIFRGKQVVVAGDSKQLRPFELYQTRWSDESDDPDLEMDSLLELAERYLPATHLQGHYRSKSLPLIAFSNQFFYANKLRLVPDRTAMQNADPVIDFIKVVGVWENQTNRAEAEAVIQQVLTLQAHHQKKEVGIITFNAPQQMLIMDLLEERFAQIGKPVPEAWFVKNIENVQGDEKDIIIFSIGYAPDKHGKMNMQFGSLTIAGGENRLNVAVSRAREKVVVVSSIMPEELKLEGIKNEGPKLLRKYLEFAREVAQGRFEPHPMMTNQHRSAWYLGTQLIQWRDSIADAVTFTPSTLPFTDVMVNKNEEMLGVILTDDELYFSGLTVKEAHAYTPIILRQKHWNYYRLHSRNWWMDPEKAQMDLKFIYQQVNQ
jgi:hypothetical protein